jgi:hypothetical protein
MKPKTATTKKPSLVDCIDGLQDCLETIGTLAGLLEAAGRSPIEPLEPGMIGHTGKLILAEVVKADEWLDKLEEAAR